MSVISRLLTGICFWTGLTPELSRVALRPWASETQWYLHEAAKRARLERIVRHHPVMPYSSDLGRLRPLIILSTSVPMTMTPVVMNRMPQAPMN